MANGEEWQDPLQIKSEVTIAALARHCVDKIVEAKSHAEAEEIVKDFAISAYRNGRIDEFYAWDVDEEGADT